MERTPLNNPFDPGSDVEPAVWAGRVTELVDWERTLRPRRIAGLYERGRAVLGEPGIGKSVLTARLSRLARDHGDVVVPPVRIPRGSDVLALVADALAVPLEGLGPTGIPGAARLLDRLRAVSVAGTGIELSGPTRRSNRHTVVTDTLVQLARAARSADVSCLVVLDEVQNVNDRDQLSQLLIGVGDALRSTDEVTDAAGGRHDRALPLVVYLTGLPEFADRATSAAGATFARRFAPMQLRPLSDADLRLALAPFTGDGWPVLGDDGPGVVTMTTDAERGLLDACLGDPFLFQLVGKAAWDAGQEPVIDAEHVHRGRRRVAAEMRGHAQRVVDGLPASELALLDALVALDPDERTLTNAARSLGRTTAEVATAARRLEDLRGVIVRGHPYRIVARMVEAYLRGGWP